MFTLVKLLVVVVLVAALASVLFGLISFLAGALWFVIKIAILIAVAYGIIHFVLRRS